MRLIAFTAKITRLTFSLFTTQESKETNLSDEELPAKPLNSDHVVPASFTTPIKLFNLNNIFNNIPNSIPPHKGDELEN